MCAPVIPLISAIGGLATAASSLGILGGNRRNMTQPQRAMTPAPSIQGPGPAASAAGDDEKTKKVDESIKIQQNAKQKEISKLLKKVLVL